MAGSLGIRWIIDRLYTWLTVTQVDFLLLVLPSFSLLLSKRTRKRTGRVPFLTPLFSIHFEYQFLASCSARKDLDTRNIPHSARLDRDLNGINGPLPCPIKSTRTGSIHFRYNRNVPDLIDLISTIDRNVNAYISNREIFSLLLPSFRI